MVWYSHLFQNFSQFIVIHTVKGFGIVNKAEIDVFFAGIISWRGVLIISIPSFRDTGVHLCYLIKKGYWKTKVEYQTT